MLLANQGVELVSILTVSKYNPPYLFFRSSGQTGRVLVNYLLKGTVLSTGGAFEEQCFVRFAINDDLKITETLESCNSLVEYDAAQSESEPAGGSCAPGSQRPNQCFNAAGTRFVCCPGQCPGRPTAVASCD